MGQDWRQGRDVFRYRLEDPSGEYWEERTFVILADKVGGGASSTLA